MSQQKTNADSGIGRIEQAMDLSDKVAQDLAVAGAQLHLNNTVLDRHLPDDSTEVELRRALSQNMALEEKVHDAAAELALTTELLEEEVAVRERLERELATTTGRPPA